MELKSEQKYDTIAVTDIDIAFPGDLQTFTLRDGVDTATLNANDTLTLNFASGGFMVFNLKHAHWRATHHRTIRVASQAAPPEQSAVGAPPANTSSTPR